MSRDTEVLDRRSSGDTNTFLEHGFYYKFDAKLETSKRLLPRYLPDDRQRSLCETLGVPAVLWSFYLFMKPIISRNLWRSIESPRDDADGLPFSKTTLSDDELFFLLHWRTLEFYRIRVACVQFPVPNLQALCFDLLLERTGARPEAKALLSALPGPLLSRVDRERQLPPLKPMPEYHRRRMRRLFRDACRTLDDLFSEADGRVFGREFVVWFQNDPFACRSFRRARSLKVVRFYFSGVGENLGDRYPFCHGRVYNVCVRCMKWHMYRKKGEMTWERRYLLDEQACFNDLQRPSHWCAECLRVPLFQVLDPSEFRKRYGENDVHGATVRVENFVYQSPHALKAT